MGVVGRGFINLLYCACVFTSAQNFANVITIFLALDCFRRVQWFVPHASLLVKLLWVYYEYQHYSTALNQPCGTDY